MHGRFCLRGLLAPVMVITLTGAGLVRAQDAPFGAPMRLVFSNANGAAQYDIPIAEGSWDAEQDQYCWALSSPTPIVAGNQDIALLISARCCVTLAPQGSIEMALCFAAGDTQDPTSVAGDAAVMINPLDQPEGRAIVSFDLYDASGDGLAQMRASGPPGDGAFDALYNDGNVFSSLVNRIRIESVEPNVPAGGINVNTSDPPDGFRTVLDTVDGLGARVELTVTPGDMLCVTSTMGLSEAVEVPCRGDLDGDGGVDIDDVTQFLMTFGQCQGDAGYDSAADLQVSGCVDLDDLTVLLRLYGSQCQ